MIDNLADLGLDTSGPYSDLVAKTPWNEYSAPTYNNWGQKTEAGNNPLVGLQLTTLTLTTFKR